jgi:MFS family permease
VQIVFVKQVLAPGTAARPLRAFAFAVLTITWAGGMLVGSLASPLAVRRFARERMIPFAITVIGACVFVAATVTSVVVVAAMWFVGGAMSGAANVGYESLLQERTPDAFRGRVMATIEAAQEASYLIGVAFAAVLLSVFEAPRALMAVGAITCVGALAGYHMLGTGEAGDMRAAEEPVPADGQTTTAATIRPRPNVLGGGGPGPQWAAPAGRPWAVTRSGSVARLDARWPLVGSDWDAIIQELSQAVDQGARAVVLPTALPAGSRVPARALDELWAALMDMSVTVTRSGERAASVGP